MRLKDREWISALLSSLAWRLPQPAKSVFRLRIVQKRYGEVLVENDQWLLNYTVELNFCSTSGCTPAINPNVRSMNAGPTNTPNPNDDDPEQEHVPFKMDPKSLPKIISFESLARCGDEIWIENNGQIYRLRRTKQGKLILTK